MVYCKNCGKEVAEDAEYCPVCGKALNVNELVLASWGERFLAYIIDTLIVGFVASILAWPGYMLHPTMPFLDLSLKSILLFLYWAYTEGTTGQSLGKKVMKIRVVGLGGEQIDMSRSLYQALGKAFLLPFDVIVGLLMYQDKEQRLFNYLSQTIVVRE